jgi:hypothetical protein
LLQRFQQWQDRGRRHRRFSGLPGQLGFDQGLHLLRCLVGIGRLAEISKKTKTQFPSVEQLLELKDLRVLAFVQNDKTKEVLQVAQVEVSGGKE